MSSLAATSRDASCLLKQPILKGRTHQVRTPANGLVSCLAYQEAGQMGSIGTSSWIKWCFAFLPCPVVSTTYVPSMLLSVRPSSRSASRRHPCGRGGRRLRIFISKKVDHPNVVPWTSQIGENCESVCDARVRCLR